MSDVLRFRHARSGGAGGDSRLTAWAGARHGRWEPVPASVGVARRFVADALHDWGVPALVDDATLVASELATNAVLHARTPFELRLQRLPDGLLLLLRDGHEALPEVRAPEPGVRVDGRGLLLLDLLCSGWGAVRDGAGGKAVWALLADVPDGHGTG